MLFQVHLAMSGIQTHNGLGYEMQIMFSNVNDGSWTGLIDFSLNYSTFTALAPITDQVVSLIPVCLSVIFSG